MSASINKTSTSDTRPPFRIRPGRRGDVEAISNLLVELGYPQGADMATVHWVISHPETETIIAADTADRPVGLLTLSHRPQLRMRGRIITIDELVVQPAWRRRGVARELVKKAMERAKVLSAKRVELLMPRDNEGALAFCRSLGLTEAQVSVMRVQSIDFERP